jgi:hypothetical protein
VFWSICLFKKENKENLDSEVAKQYDTGGFALLLEYLGLYFYWNNEKCRLKENINMLNNDCTYLIT